MKKIFVIFALLLCNVCLCVAQTLTSATLTTNVKTPNGATVPDTYIITEIPATAGDIAAAQNLVANYGGTYLGAPTWTYNCHAYAWHMTNGNNSTIINTPVWIGWTTSNAHNIYWHSTNGGYVAVAESNATKVNYPPMCNHSAIRESQYVYVSKWGQGPLARHAPYALPPQFNPQHYQAQGLNPGSFGYYAIANYTVSFNANGGSPTPSPQSVQAGKYATTPSPQPTKGGSTFGGWYDNSGLAGSAVNFSTYKITSNKTFYAKWTVTNPNPVITGPSYINCGGSEQYFVTSGYSTYEWQSGSILTLMSPSSTTTAYYSAPNNLYWDEFDKVICKVNGVAYTKGVDIFSCYSPVSTYPNPATSVLNVEIVADAIAELKASRNLTADPVFDIRLYDEMGNMVRQTSNRSATTQINVAGLPSGVYSLHVYNGVHEKPVVKQIVVQ